MSGRGGKRILNAREKALFRYVMRDAEPLTPEAGDMAGLMTPEPQQNQSTADDLTKIRTSVDPDKLFRSLKISERQPAEVASRLNRDTALPRHEMLKPEGDTPGVDRRTETRLARGRFDIDARLDLHGCNRTEAETRLGGFVMTGYERGWRCLLVITGKGRIGKEGGVLRRSLPEWLNGSRLRPMVLAIKPAQPRDGGAGAFYVLLRRQRSMESRR